ncbi:hypothetical protein BKA80DRAFT_284673 [Phyllosticta citrichinensis]
MRACLTGMELLLPLSITCEPALCHTTAQQPRVDQKQDWGRCETEQVYKTEKRRIQFYPRASALHKTPRRGCEQEVKQDGLNSTCTKNQTKTVSHNALAALCIARPKKNKNKLRFARSCFVCFVVSFRCAALAAETKTKTRAKRSDET